MLRRRALLALLASSALANTAQGGAPLQIVATIGQIADLASRLAGERAVVRALMGEGVDPHTYRQTRADVLTLRRADLVLAVGLWLEAQLVDLLTALATEKPVLLLAERLPPERLLAHPDFPGKFDPHVWMDVALWSELVPILEVELARLDPADAAGYRERARAYRAELAALERYVRRVLATVPPERRVLVTAHDAFGYFGRAYGFEVHGIQGLSTESEAGLAEIERLVRLIVERRIGAVFVESSVAERNVRALVEGAAARGHEVRIGGQLFSDAMDAPGTYEGTYVGMIDHNVTVIARALGGEAPPRGMNGRLATVG
ncbi:MAG: manganese transporter [Geminicoccaceae bacterium]|nr:MAG: manganese transporter [Geminicoccaceae bacterium]